MRSRGSGNIERRSHSSTPGLVRLTVTSLKAEQPGFLLLNGLSEIRAGVAKGAISN